MDLIRSDGHVCAELECNIQSISGGEIPCGYGCAFSSVIVRGTAEILEDVQQKIHGLKLLMKNQTGKEFVIDERMAESVAVIKITSDALSAKARTMPQ